MIKNIVFDIGNVITVFCWGEYLKNLGYEDEMINRIAKATVLSNDWKEYDRGVLSNQDILNRFIENDREIEADIRKMEANMHGIVKKVEYAIPWIRTLKEHGYQVYYLSNFSCKIEAECMDALDFMPYMDGGILSYRDKVIKPDEKIYQLLCERYHLIPEECVFLDDTKENIDAAIKLGWHAIWFKNEKDAKEKLKELGVE